MIEILEDYPYLKIDGVLVDLAGWKPGQDVETGIGHQDGFIVLCQSFSRGIYKNLGDAIVAAKEAQTQGSSLITVVGYILKP